MTTDVTVPNNQQAQSFMQSLSPQQMQTLMQALTPQVRQQDFLMSTLESLADRLAGNGLTSDMAGHWARSLEAAVSDHTPESVKSFVNDLTSQLHAGGDMNSFHAAQIARSIRPVLQESAPQSEPSVIDTTATPVESGQPSQSIAAQGPPATQNQNPNQSNLTQNQNQPTTPPAPFE